MICILNNDSEKLAFIAHCSTDVIFDFIRHREKGSVVFPCSPDRYSPTTHFSAAPAAIPALKQYLKDSGCSVSHEMACKGV